MKALQQVGGGPVSRPTGPPRRSCRLAPGERGGAITALFKMQIECREPDDVEFIVKHQIDQSGGLGAFHRAHPSAGWRHRCF
ncbi:MAG: hypothetical protein JWO51_4187 [Rhodospirillales bacterium]|nr:hypothetical protein [Rhodospirillales bacterium]